MPSSNVSFRRSAVHFGCAAVLTSLARHRFAENLCKRGTSPFPLSSLSSLSDIINLCIARVSLSERALPLYPRSRFRARVYRSTRVNPFPSPRYVCQLTRIASAKLRARQADAPRALVSNSGMGHFRVLVSPFRLGDFN